jgi:UV DNA damage endonuclease
MKKIGYCCKTSAIRNGKIVSIPEYNYSATTITWLNAQPQDIAVQRLWELMRHNVSATRNVIQKLSILDPSLRMFRMGSDMLSAYTHPRWAWFYKQSDVINFLESNLAEVGNLARSANIRLSFHPGQFCVLASDNPDIVKNSIEEFEYHADIARWMGYGRQFQDFKINVHISGKNGPDGIRNALNVLSTEARNCLTIENDEFIWGIDTSLQLEHDVALVLDIHHHFIQTGEYISPTDSRVSRIIDSWRGVRPVLHYSISREDYLVNHDPHIAPDLSLLLSQGYKKQKLRAHSDRMWNTAVNDWALSFLEVFDIQVEAKFKNIASTELYDYAKSSNMI